MKIPWLKITIIVFITVILLKGGGLATGILSIILANQPNISQAQESLPVPSTAPTPIQNNPEKRKDAFDLKEQDNKVNKIDQKTRQVIEKSDIPVVINQRVDENKQNTPKPSKSFDWSKDQVSSTEYSTFLDLMKKSLSEREAIIKQKQAQLEKTLKKYNSANDEKILRLVSIYSTMKSKSAAEIFNEMDINTLLPIAQNIIPRKLAPILASMKPEKARILSEELSGRSADIESLRKELVVLTSEQKELDTTKDSISKNLQKPEADKSDLLPKAEKIKP